MLFVARSRFSRHAPLAIALTILAPAAWPAPSGHQLETVRVDDAAAAVPATPTTTDGRLGLSERETPATVSTVDRDDIEQLGLRNLIELYRSAPGVAAGNIPGSPASVSMRGRLSDRGSLWTTIMHSMARAVLRPSPMAPATVPRSPRASPPAKMPRWSWRRHAPILQ